MATDQATRRAPYDGDLRRDLLDAAIAFVAANDPADLSLRSIAREVGVSHAAPKNHFADKTALLTAIAIEGFDRLAQALLLAIAETDGPNEAMLAGGMNYVTFSIENPGYFRVMWRNELLDQEDEQLLASGEMALDGLRRLVEDAQTTGWAADRSSTDVAVLAWAAVHGLAQLYLDGPLEALVEPDIAALGRGLVDLLHSSLA